MATKNIILGTVPKSRGRYTEGDTTTKWYYDNILEYKGSAFRCISEASTGITGAPAIYNASTHTLVPNTDWEFFVDTTGTLTVEERLTENEEKLSELDKKVDALALGAFYGYFPDSASLPIDVTIPGYAYVGTDNPYEIWNFNGESWTDSSTSIDMNDADEEDITRNADGKLQFKDRAFGDGMGYIILRKNKSFAEQITKENTIYEIRYNFTLESNVTVPANCVLKFNGGSILGEYTITGNKTEINAGLIKIFDTRIKLEGYWNVTEAYPEWFGAKGDGSDYDNSPAINACINNTPFRKVILKNGGIYVIYSSIILKSKNFYFGSNSNVNEYNSFDEKPVGAKLLSRANIIAVKVPEKAFEIEIHGLTIYQGWANRFTGVGIEFAEDKSINSCKFFGLKICYFNVGFRAIFRDSYAGISLCHFTDCSFLSCLVGMYIYYYDFSVQDKKWWMNLNHFDNCHWSYNAYGGLYISGVYSFEQNLFSACGFESNGRNLNSEGWPNYDNNDIYGLKITSNKGYGLSTFDNCYFEINLANGTNNTQTYEETNGNENVFVMQSDVQLSGAQCQFRQCTFNYGITPIICFGDRPVKLTIDNCDFKNVVGEAFYKGNNIVLIRKAALSSTGEKCYITLNQGFLEPKWLNAPISTLNVTGLTFMAILINTPGLCAAKSQQAFDTRKRRYQSIKVDDEFIKIIDYPLFGTTDERPIIDIGGNSSIYGFQFFDRTLGKPIYWNGSNWIDATGTTV